MKLSKDTSDNQLDKISYIGEHIVLHIGHIEDEETMHEGAIRSKLAELGKLATEPSC